MRIQNNVTAINTHRVYGINNNNIQKSAEKLASGFRVNRAGDDPAGLAISEKMRAQVRGLNMASKNSMDAISYVQTAEGALQEVHAILQKMNGIAVQAANGINDTVDVNALKAEYVQLNAELGDIGKLKFNGKAVFNATTAASAVTIQVGPETANTMLINQPTAPVATTTSFGSSEEARIAIDTLVTDINNVSTIRSLLGAAQNRLEHKIANLDVNAENLQAAESRIRDVDMAKEMTNYTKNNILSQAATAMLAQANNAPQQVLQLLR